MAKAEGWKISYKMSGTVTKTEDDGTDKTGPMTVPGQTATETEYPPIAETSTGCADFSIPGGRKFAPLTAEVDGHFTVVFTWTEDVAPPDNLSFLVTARAQARMGSGFGAETVPEAKTDSQELKITDNLPMKVTVIRYDSKETDSQSYHNRSIASAPNQKGLVTINTNGQKQVEWEAPHFHLKATSPGGTIMNGDTSIGAWQGGDVSSSLQADIDTRSVKLTSDIESSYKKSDTLPRNKDGSIAFDKMRSSSPSASSAGPYSVLCEPEKDGSMKVHSAAEYVGHDLINNLGAPFWNINSVVEAQTPGFANPGFNGYTWSNSGLAQMATIPGQYLYPLFDLGPVFNKRRLQEGSPWDGAAAAPLHHLKPEDIKGKTNTVTVTVTDPTDGAVGSNTYDIAWHLPFENWQLIGTDHLSPQKKPGVQGTTGGSSTSPGGDLEYKYSDLNEIEVGDTKEFLAKSGSLAKVAAAAGTLVYKVAEVDEPWAVAGLLLAGEALSTGSDFATEAPPTKWRPLPTDWSQYKDDLQREKDSQGWSDVDPPNPGIPYVTHTFSGTPLQLAKLIDSANNAQGDERKDPYFQNGNTGISLSVSGFVLRNVTRDSYKGDHYDRNGYLGLGYGAVSKYGPPMPRMTWTLGTTTPGPNGTAALNAETTLEDDSDSSASTSSVTTPSGANS